MSVVIRTARRHRFNGLLAAFYSSLAAWRGDRFEATGACLRYMSTRSRRRSEERKRKQRMQKFKAVGNYPLRVAGPRELPEGLGSSTHDLKGKCLMAEKDYDVGEVIATAPVWGFVPPLAQAREDSWCARVKLHLPGEGGDGYEAYVDPLTPGPITRHLDPAKVRKAFALSFEPFLDFMGCGGTGSRQPVVAAILFLRSLGFLGHPQVRWTKPPVVRPDLIDEDEEDEVIAARLNLNNDFFKKSMEGFGLLTSVAHEAWGEAGQGMFKGDYETLRNVMKNLLRSPDAADTILRSYFPFKNYVTVRGVIRVNGFGLPLEDLWCEARSPTEQLDGHFEQPGDLTGLAVPPPEEQGGDDESKVVDGEGSAEGSATSEAATGDASSSKDNPRDMATAPSAAVGADGVPRHVTPSGLSTPALDPAGWAGSLLMPDVGKAEAQGLGQGQGQGSSAGEGAIDGGVVENLGGKAPGVTNEKDGSDHGRGAADPEEGPGSSSMQAVGQPQSVGTHDGDGRASILQQLAEHAQAQSSQAQQLKDGGLQYSAPTDRASALFGPVVSLMNHSCHPNVDFRMVVRVPSQSADSAAPKRAVMLNSPDQRPVRAGESVWEEEFDVFTRSAVYTRLVARRPVKKGDELMITYIDANRPADARYNLLRDSFNFECACERKCDLDDVEAEQYRQQAAAAAMEAGRGSGYDLEGRPIFAEDGEDGDETEAELDAQSAAPREEGVPVFPDAEEQEKLMQRLARRRSKQDVDREQGMEAMSESARQTGEVAKDLSESQAARSMATSPFVHPDRHYGTNVGKVFHVAEVDVSDSEDEDEEEGAAQGAAGKAAAASLDAGSGSRAPTSSIPEQESGAPRVPGLASPLELARRKRQAQARLAEKLKAAGGGDGHNEGGSGRQ